MIKIPNKTFDLKTNPLTHIQLRQINGDIRLYETPDNKRYPSMTTVLKQFDDGSIDEWKEFVGEEEATRIVEDASDRGNLLHQMCEEYLNNCLKLNKYSARLKVLFNLLKPELNNIDSVYALEQMLYSDHYKIAGTVDCIATYNNFMSTIDFKGSTQPIEKQTIYGRRKIFKYMLQACGYSIMVEELTGIQAKQLVILVAVQSLRKCQVFKAPRKLFEKEFKLCLNSYHNDTTLIEKSAYWRL